jgi:hypothetical protein
VAVGNRLRLYGEAAQRSLPSFRQHVVEDDRIQATDQQVAVGMDVVVVGHRLQSVLLLRAEEDFVGDGSAQRTDATALQIGKRVQPACVSIADRDHLTEGVVGNRRRHRRASRRRVFHAAQPDVRGAAFDRLVDRGVRDEEESRSSVQTAGDQLGNLDVEPADFRRVGGVGFDERRAAFGIARPFQFRLLCASDGAGQQQRGDCDEEPRSGFKTQRAGPGR